MRNEPPAPRFGRVSRGLTAARHRTARGIWLVILCVAVTLGAIGAGGAFAAQRVAQATHVSAHAVSFTTELAPITRSGASSQQASVPVSIESCSCSPTHDNIPAPAYGVPQMSGQVVLVSLTQQWLWAYQDQRLVLATPVTTGMPQLPTPTGVYHISMKEANVWFYSPWPYGSPYYYTPEHVDYAMLFRSGGFYLHAAAWRHAFGPGTNVPHTNPDGSYETGSHGCVNLPVPAAGVLYTWIGIGATVVIVR